MCGPILAAEKRPQKSTQFWAMECTKLAPKVGPVLGQMLSPGHAQVIFWFLLPACTSQLLTESATKVKAGECSPSGSASVEATEKHTPCNAAVGSHRRRVGGVHLLLNLRDATLTAGCYVFGAIILSNSTAATSHSPRKTLPLKGCYVDADIAQLRLRDLPAFQSTCHANASRNSKISFQRFDAMP